MNDRPALSRSLDLLLALLLLLLTSACSTTTPSLSTDASQSSLPTWAEARSIGARALPLKLPAAGPDALPDGLKLTAGSATSPTWGKPIGPAAAPNLGSAKQRNRPAAAPAPRLGPARATPAVIINNHGGSGGKESAPEPGAAAAPLSRIESLYNRVPDASRGKRLLQYGYDSIRPGTDGGGAAAVGADYQVGPGDELQLRSTGGLELDDVQTIDREGRIFIERVGPILVSGTAVAELSRVIQTALEREYQDVQLSVSLSKVRQLSLTITGFVKRPGQVSVPANASLLDMLGAAGGVEKRGSLRAIRWSRGKASVLRGTAKTLDLYDLFLDGQALDLPQIQAGDVLHVPAIGSTAAITAPGGAGIYELASGETLAALVAYAGADNAFTDAESIQLERAGRGSRRVLHDLTAANLGGTAVTDTDVLFLPEVPDITANPVTLEGAVVRPGTSAWAKGMRVKDLLERGGGLLLDASLERALLRRNLAGAAREQLVWIELDAVLRGKSKANLELSPHDTLRIFTRDEDAEQGSVSIVGAVRQAGSFSLSAGLTLGDLLKLAGGPNEKAFRGESILVRKALSADGRRFDAETYPFDLSEALAGGQVAQTPLQDEDHIVVREMQSGEVAVSVSGQVQFPGTYTLERGAQITDLIAQAGGVLDDADLRAAVFSRQRVRNQQQQRLNDMFTRTTERHTRIRNPARFAGLAAVRGDRRPRPGQRAHRARFPRQELPPFGAQSRTRTRRQPARSGPAQHHCRARPGVLAERVFMEAGSDREIIPRPGWRHVGRRRPQAGLRLAGQRRGGQFGAEPRPPRLRELRSRTRRCGAGAGQRLGSFGPVQSQQRPRPVA